MRVIRLEETDSTNNYAKSHIREFEDRTVIHALKQTNGRGRLNRCWVDLGSGNLFCSIVLKPSFTFNAVYSNLTQYACVVLCKVLEKFDICPKIKWPNDVMIDGQRKISGILCETLMEAGKLEGIVLGIGVNLNSNENDVKNIPDRIVTALNLEIKKSVDMEEFFEDLLKEFFKNYDKFLEKGFEYIKDDYIKRNCFLNKDLSVQVLSNVKSGYASNITDGGELVLKNNDKELILNIGDIL